MKTSHRMILLIAAFAPAAQPARADLSVVQRTTVDAPGLKRMLAEIPAERRAPLLKMLSPIMTGTPWITTTYLKGERMRTDMGLATTVVNAVTGNQFTLNHQAHSYSIGPYNPFQKAAGSMTCRIQATNRTESMLGHTARRYTISMKSSVLPGSAITGEIWTAPDLPTPPSPGFAEGAAAAMQTEMAKVKGMPLAYRLVYRNTPAGDITVTSYATRIARDTLAASAFAIPPSYHRGAARTATATPSSGFPLGDGMPLDSMAEVTDEAATGRVAANPSSALQALGLGGGLGAGQAPAGLSPALLQKLLSSVGGANGAGAGLGGGSPADLSQLMGGGSGDISQLMGGGSGDISQLMGGASGDLGASLPSPQELQQIGAQLKSLLSDDGE